MTYTELVDNVSGNDPYRRRVEYALYVAAVAVMAEVATTTNHDQRLVYAAKVLNGQADLKSAVYASLTNQSLKGALSLDKITDDDLQFTINSLVDALAGAGK